MDVKEMIAKAVETIKSDGNIAESFKSDPVKTLEKILGVDLPDDIVEKLVSGVKAKLGEGGAAGILGKIKDLL